MSSHWKDLEVWKQSHQLVLSIYGIIQSFPPDEKYALADQVKRAAYSVPANIVEGHSRSSKKEFIKYLYISRASLEELRYFLLLSHDLGFLNADSYLEFEKKCVHISKMINGLIKSLK